MHLVDKVAIVTGAGRGIGKAIAIALAREGANVIIIDVDIQTVEKVAKEIESMGRHVLAIDVGNYKKIFFMVILIQFNFKTTRATLIFKNNIFFLLFILSRGGL